MNCSAYNEFYSLLASSTLILISIFTALSAILWQDKSIDQKEIGKKIQNLINSINDFIEIMDAVAFAGLRRSPKKPEDIIDDVIDNYNNWKYRQGEYGLFLNKLDILQKKIHSELIERLNDFDKKDMYNNDFRYRISKDEYKSFMKNVYPYLDKIEGMHTSIYPIIQDNKKNWFDNFTGRSDEKEYFKGFYENYWDVLLEIREESIEIDKNMHAYNKAWFNSMLDSSVSIFWIKLSLIILFFFDILIPFYMIQPNQIGILSYNVVFYITILSLVFCYIFIVLAYEKRYKYPLIFEEFQQKDLASGSRWKEKLSSDTERNS